MVPKWQCWQPQAADEAPWAMGGGAPLPRMRTQGRPGNGKLGDWRLCAGAGVDWVVS